VRISRASPLVLGSASSRRSELLRLAGIPFVVRSVDIDESAQPAESAQSYLVRVARAKLDAVRALDLSPSGACLVADTIVIAPDGALLGKPRDVNEARSMILRLAGAVHEVSTRFLLAENPSGASPACAETITTRVMFREIEPDEASAYAVNGEGRDKAGGYAIQGSAAMFIRRIDGSYTNVVGLPLCEVFAALRALGWLEAP
jgi:septum formation protein